MLRGTGPRGARGEMSRHYGGGDVYARRRLWAGVGVVVVLFLLFVLLGGC
jgi:hypothetical protein